MRPTPTGAGAQTGFGLLLFAVRFRSCPDDQIQTSCDNKLWPVGGFHCRKRLVLLPIFLPSHFSFQELSAIQYLDTRERDCVLE